MWTVMVIAMFFEWIVRQPLEYGATHEESLETHEHAGPGPYTRLVANMGPRIKYEARILGYRGPPPPPPIL